jgi:hypothetical protein
MEKKKYIVPIVEELELVYPIMQHLFDNSDLPDDQNLAPHKRTEVF